MKQTRIKHGGCNGSREVREDEEKGRRRSGRRRVLTVHANAWGHAPGTT